jgi:hypothetical protein
VIRAIASLARHRLAGRAGATLLLVAAVAAATGLTGTIRALGLSATDAAVAGSLDRLDDGDRTVRISAYKPSLASAGDLDRAARSAAARMSAFAGAPTAGVIFRRVHDPGVLYDLQLVGVDGAAAWIDLAAGRMPSACDRTSCEAVLLSVVPTPADLPEVVHVGTLEIRIVGRATLTSPVPLGHLDERGPLPPPLDPTTETIVQPAALLLVDGVQAAAGGEGAGAVGRSYLWTSALDAGSIHPWTAGTFETALTAARRTLPTEGTDLFLTAPSEAIRAELARGAVNDGRLLLIGTLGVAILVAFAGYAALLGRRDLRAELERLAVAGAGRAAGAALVGLEVLAPTALGTVAGWLGAAVVARVLATGSGTDPGGIVSHALTDAGSLTLAVVVFGASVGSVLAGLLGAARREAIAGLVPGALALAAFVAWRLIAGSGLDTAALGGSVEAPIIAAIPALVGIAVAALALAVVPIILRRLATAARHRSAPVRLALLSLARDPVRPAATITLLAFGIGGLVFGITDGATLQRGIQDQAAFAVGMDLRVVEAGTGLTNSATVAPFARYATLGEGAMAFPVAHAQVSAGTAGQVAVLGLPPAALPQLRGWRDDLGVDAVAIGDALDVLGDFTVPGIALPAEDATIAITVQHEGDPVYLSAVVATDGGDAARIFLGTLKPGRKILEAALPAGARGGRLIGLIVSEGRLIAGSLHAAGLARATLTFDGLEALVGPDPVAVEVSGTATAVLRAPLPTDDLVVPAIVGPDVAAAARASVDGTLSLSIGESRLARIRVAGVLPRFPGAPEAEDAFVVVALDPLLMALDGVSPGAGRPDEAWIRVDDPGHVDAVVTALQAPPFRSAAIRSRAGLAAAAAADPFAGSVIAAFAAAGAAGLLLAALGLALGALADLRDETGELRDLEAQGLGPRALRRQVRARTLILSAAGTLSGLVMGVGLAWVVTAALGIGATASRPVPPLVLETPWSGLLAAFIVPMLAAAALAGLAAGRAFRAAARTRDGA